MVPIGGIDIKQEIMKHEIFKGISSWVAMGIFCCQAAGAQEVVTITDENIGENLQWTAEKEWLLDGFVFVEEGEVLTIEAGTVIRGKPGQAENASALIIARGGKIMAEGTPEAPIIFTSENDDLSDPFDLSPEDKGLWGGVILLGRATLNSPAGNDPIVDNIEGIPTTEPRGEFGGSDDTDSSGVMRYVSIRHGGTNIGANNEINGLTFGGVGSGTVVEFIEVYANLDDGFEFFGGTVKTKYMFASYVGDDSFDYDQGFRGEGQFWFSLATGDRGGEHDGDVDNFDSVPLSNPTIYNVTYIGPGEGSGDALKFRENAAGKYYNSVFTQFGDKAVDVDSELKDDEGNVIGEDPTPNNIATGELDLRENLFFDFGNTGENASSSAAQPFFTEADRNNQMIDPQLGSIDVAGTVDPRPQAGSPALAAGREEVADGFFCDVAFKGAFGDINWVGAWTISAAAGLITQEGAGVPDYPLAGETELAIDPQTVQVLESGSFSFGWIAESGKSYQIYATESMSPPDWQPAGDSIVGDGSIQTFEESTAGKDGKFFQVREL